MFVNDCIYHVYNRGVEKRILFQTDSDHLRFIHDLYEFNDTKPTLRYSEVRPPQVRKRDLLVEIYCFCLMPNHFHLILKQLKDNGIYLFMKKLGTGYSMYFNKLNNRVGSLFQGRFKAILIENNEYLLHLSRYIHLNSVELIEKNWKSKGIKNWAKVKKFLKFYRWSSYPDYLDVDNFPSVTRRDFIISLAKGKNRYKKFVEDFISKDINKIKSLSFE